jgi:hypothetical protein
MEATIENEPIPILIRCNPSGSSTLRAPDGIVLYCWIAQRGES